MPARDPYYQDDYVTLYHGDCREIVPELGTFDCVITDPPYGVGLADWDRYPTQEELNLFLDVSPAVAMFGAASPHCIEALISLRPRCDRIYIWHNTFTLTNSDGSFWQWQPIYTWGKPFKGLGKDVLIYPATDDSTRWHPAQKSNNLMLRLIDASADTILDPFAGSGTTLVAAKQLNRKAVGIEIEERYCEIAARRCAQEILPLEYAQEAQPMQSEIFNA